MLDFYSKNERSIRHTLRELAKQRVAIVAQPGNVWVVEKSLPQDDATKANLSTCLIRGWVEVLEHAVPAASLPADMHLPPTFRFDRVDPIYRLTSAGWSVIHGAHPLSVLALVIAIASLVVSITFNLAK